MAIQGHFWYEYPIIYPDKQLELVTEIHAI